jgi:hypothetical protein
MSAAITFQVARDARSSRFSQVVCSRPRIRAASLSDVSRFSVFGPR